jgi:hypothetical protein
LAGKEKKTFCESFFHKEEKRKTQMEEVPNMEQSQQVDIDGLDAEIAEKQHLPTEQPTKADTRRKKIMEIKQEDGTMAKMVMRRGKLVPYKEPSEKQITAAQHARETKAFKKEMDRELIPYLFGKGLDGYAISLMDMLLKKTIYDEMQAGRWKEAKKMALEYKYVYEQTAKKDIEQREVDTKPAVEKAAVKRPLMKNATPAPKRVKSEAQPHHHQTIFCCLCCLHIGQL